MENLVVFYVLQLQLSLSWAVTKWKPFLFDAHKIKRSTFSLVSSAFWRTHASSTTYDKSVIHFAFSWSAFLSEMDTFSSSLSFEPNFWGPFSLSSAPAKSPSSTVIGSWHASLDSLSSTLGLEGADSLSFDATAR